MYTSTIVDYVQQLLDDTAGSYFTDALVLAWVNEGQTEFVARSECYQKNIASNSVQYTAAVSTPTDFIRAVSVRWKNASSIWTPLHETSIRDVYAWATTGKLSTGGTPELWYYDKPNRTIAIYPTNTSSATSTDCVGIDYIAKPATMTAVSTPAIEADYHMALVYWGCFWGKMREEKETVAEYYRKLFYDIVDKAKADKAKRNTNTSQIYPEEYYP